MRIIKKILAIIFFTTLLSHIIGCATTSTTTKINHSIINAPNTIGIWAETSMVNFDTQSVASSLYSSLSGERKKIVGIVGDIDLNSFIKENIANGLKSRISANIKIIDESDIVRNNKNIDLIATSKSLSLDAILYIVIEKTINDREKGNKFYYQTELKVDATMFGGSDGEKIWGKRVKKIDSKQIHSLGEYAKNPIQESYKSLSLNIVSTILPDFDPDTRIQALNNEATTDDQLATIHFKRKFRIAGSGWKAYVTDQTTSENQSSSYYPPNNEVGIVGSGGTLSWKRPAGKFKINIKMAGGSAGTSPEIEVLPGEVKYIFFNPWTMSNSDPLFEISNAPF